MTTFLVLTALIVVFVLGVGLRIWRSDRPVNPPVSHEAWATGRLPSHPYAR